MTLVFATHNQNKFLEVKALMPDHIELLSLTDIDCHDEIPETGKTLTENARLKADHVTKNYKLSCFADDTGLLVDALNGAPGIYSARYAGEQKSSEDNMQKLLTALQDKPSRDAYFKTVIALNINGKIKLFEGIVKGKIIKEKRGKHGFGYDPIFLPNGHDQTFAELPFEVKNKISHRANAIQALIDYLNTASS
jgi:XTP/dITP diphosphohydrolase